MRVFHRHLSGIVMFAISAFFVVTASEAHASAVESIAVQTDHFEAAWPLEGVVQAVRQSDMAVQVAGTVTQIAVKVGDRVRTGQLLARVDARSAQQSALASAAQADSAQANLELEQKDFERKKQLFGQGYISQAAMDRAQAQYKAASAVAHSQSDLAAVARIQSGLFDLVAPYAGIVANVAASVGDMALPGKTLLTVYDPVSLRVSAWISQTQAQFKEGNTSVRVELPDLASPPRSFDSLRPNLLPSADPVTHTVELRVDLPASAVGARPGQFARVWLPGKASGIMHLFVPTKSILRRSEITIVYVVNAQGISLLRQVRIGQTRGEQTEILAGLATDERVAVDPVAAARQ